MISHICGIKNEKSKQKTTTTAKINEQIKLNITVQRAE